MSQGVDKCSSAWVLTRQQKILEVKSDGQIIEVSQENFAESISYSIDKTLWVLPKKNGHPNNQILYSEDKGQNWIGIDLSDVRVQKISAHLGSCLILTPQGSVYLVQKAGKIEKIFDDGTANDIAVSPEGFIWIISRKKKAGGGNLVFWCSLSNLYLQPAVGQPVAKKISAGPEGTARIITIGGEVSSLFLTRMGGLETPSGELFAKNIGASCLSNTIWIIGPDNQQKRKQNVLKCWNPDIDPYMKWHTISGVEPYQIAGGE